MAEEQVETDAAAAPADPTGEGLGTGRPPGASNKSAPPVDAASESPNESAASVDPFARSASVDPSARGAELAEPLPDDAGATPPFPDVLRVPDIDPSAPGVIEGATGDDGSQSFFLDQDGDGVFETSATGVPLGDGTFKIVELRPLDEPFAPGDEPPTDIGGGNEGDRISDGVFDPDGETPPVGDSPGAGGDAAVPGEVAVDLPELYESPPEYATGSGSHSPPAATPGQPAAVPVDDAPPEAPGYPTSPDETGPDNADEPITVQTEDDENNDDPGLLEQVADAVGDLWDDTKDVVT